MDFGSLLPPRSIEDILAERVRLIIDGQPCDLPVLPIAENRAWKERMDLELGLLLANISVEDDSMAMLGLFDESDELFWGLLRDYDTSGVLPSREVVELTEKPLWPIRAALEVWRAARPLADIALTGASLTLEPPTNGSRPHMPTWLRRFIGPRATSSAN